MDRLAFKVITEPNEAKKIWESLSKNETIDDEWDFRNTSIMGLGFQLNFIVGFENDKAIGVLPLQLNTNKGISQKLLQAKQPFLEFFGGMDTDNNRVLLLPGYEQYSELFYKQIPTMAILTSLKDKISINGQESEYYLDKYILDLQNITSFQDYLDKYFEGKSKKRLAYRINKLKRDYKIDIQQGSDEDLEMLFELSKRRFGENSSFHMEYRRNSFREMRKFFDVDIFTISFNGIKRAVAYGIKYKKTYVSINMGYDNEIRDIAKLIFVTRLERALERGDKIYDAGQGNNGWKEFFHLSKIPQYKLTINQPSSQLI